MLFIGESQNRLHSTIIDTVVRFFIFMSLVYKYYTWHKIFTTIEYKMHRIKMEKIRRFKTFHADL